MMKFNVLFLSRSKGLMNPGLRSPEEPCRHKILDLIGDVSLFARNGSQGLPVANIIAYKVCLCHVRSGCTVFDLH